MMHPTELAARLAGSPHVSLAQLPTPLDVVPRLGAAIGLPSLRVKRDDLTGFALGGNKSRQLEYLMGEARSNGATAIVTGAGVDSNHLRHTAAACARLGMKACLLVRGERPAQVEGNLLLDGIFGAECRFLGERFYADFATSAERWSQELREGGETPYLIDTLGNDSRSLGVAALGYVQAALELEEQFAAQGWRPELICLCSGGASQAGLLAAKHALGASWEVLGISASPFIQGKDEIMAKVATRALRLLGLGATVTSRDVTNLDAYIGTAYGVPTPESRDALLLAARTEGLLLDPTYTSKALAGLIDRRRRGLVDEHANILFIHTGGAPNLFLGRNAQIGS